MPIPFRAPAASALLNQTFVNKTIDDLKKGKLGLYKTLPTDPDRVDDVQEFLNTLADTVGQDGEFDANRKNYSSNNVIVDGDSYKESIEKLDIDSGVKQAQLTALSQLIADGTRKLISYDSDTSYELDNPALVGGEIYYNTSTGLVRFYNFVDSQWEDVGKSVLPVQEVPTGLVNGINTNFDISSAPLGEDAINVYVNGLIVPKSEWSFLSPTITLNFAPAYGQDIYVTYLSDGNPSVPVVAVGTNNVIYYSLTALDITNKSFNLPSIPSTPSHVMVDVVGGTVAVFGSDFNIVGSLFDFDGLGLDGLLNSGDILRIQYFN